MKIFRNNKVYVQLKDIIILTDMNMEIPKKIYEGCSSIGVTYNSITSRYELIEYSDPFCIEFFKNLDFIVDYDEYIGISTMNFDEIYRKLNNRINAIINYYNKLNSTDKIINMSLKEECILLQHKRDDISGLYWYNQGEGEYDLPDEIVNSNVRKLKD